MTRARAFAPVVLLGASLALSGCIAAVIPLAAGAVVAKRVDAIETRAAKLDKAAAAASSRRGETVTLTNLTSLPPPDPALPTANAAVASFHAYALAQAELQPGAGTRPSAIIPDASDLTLVRSQCGRQQSAVFVDLDPGRGTFDPLAPGLADPSLGAALADLRAREVKIVWFSRLSANFAEPARAALAAGGLDPQGGDEIVLMRDIGERKQTLRDEVAKRLCPIAILGDERADFDELYLYLKNPDAALALDAMIGKGWFLASPFTRGPAPATGVTP
ncbi:MAG: hypothetical protein EOP59_08730 [Sphingomonadales bacterium]|nr:MAG: hypothetical protein EOP59_08730 [Sphingomonadales bacterium]